MFEFVWRDFVVQDKVVVEEDEVRRSRLKERYVPSAQPHSGCLDPKSCAALSRQHHTTKYRIKHPKELFARPQNIPCAGIFYRCFRLSPLVSGYICITRCIFSSKMSVRTLDRYKYTDSFPNPCLNIRLPAFSPYRYLLLHDDGARGATVGSRER